MMFDIEGYLITLHTLKRLVKIALKSNGSTAGSISRADAGQLCLREEPCKIP